MQKTNISQLNNYRSGMNQIRTLLSAAIYSLMIFMMIILWSQYRFLCFQAQELVALKEQYRSFIKAVASPKTEKHSSANFNEPVSSDIVFDNEFEDEQGDVSLQILDRKPDHLKKTTLEYVKDQELDSLITRINEEEWNEYTGQVTEVPVVTKEGGSKSISKSKPHSKKVVKGDMPFVWPLDKDTFWISSLFGPRKKKNGSWGHHNGTDMAALKGTPIKAAASGTVIEARHAPGYGKTIIIKHNNKYKTRYAHLHKIDVDIGQKVKQGVIIGAVGDTGHIRKSGKDGSHLHFELYENEKRVNPLHYLPELV